MWDRCCDGFIKGGLLPEDPTTSDKNYPIGFLGWTAAGKAFLHIGSGTWIDLSGGGSGSGVSSINGATGSITIVGTPPITVGTTGTTVTIGSTASAGIQSIITDNGTATPNGNGEVEILGVQVQGTSTSAP